MTNRVPTGDGLDRPGYTTLVEVEVAFTSAAATDHHFTGKDQASLTFGDPAQPADVHPALAPLGTGDLPAAVGPGSTANLGDPGYSGSYRSTLYYFSLPAEHAQDHLRLTVTPDADAFGTCTFTDLPQS